MVSDAHHNKRDCSFAEGRASSRFRAGRTESSDVKGDAELQRLSYVPVGTKRQTYHIRLELIAMGTVGALGSGESGAGGILRGSGSE